MIAAPSFFTVGVFAESEQKAKEFASNLLLTHTVCECALKLEKAEREYEEAILQKDEMRAERKKLEIEACKVSLQFTANFFDALGEVGK
tara:strand:+ start:1571 stop:1837 length:267 start_codon:yes stop_codon:yes gene_type:complete